MADENKTSTTQSSQQNAGNSQGGEQQSGTQQNTTFDPNNYNNDPKNMANYTGNYGTGTYDTDYGEGEYPRTNAKEQGENWVDRVDTTQQSSGSQKQGQSNTNGNQ